MSEIKITENLSQKLGEETLGKIKFLTDFEAGIKEKLSQDNCPDIVRNIVANKMKYINDVVLKLYTIASSHVSNEQKKEKMQEVLSNMDSKAFLNELEIEIKSAREILLKRAKTIGKEIEQEANEAVESIEKMVKSNQEFVSEEKARLKQEETKLKRRRYHPELAEQQSENTQEVEKNDESSKNLPIKAESLGFWKTFKKLRAEGKENPDKKIGIFSALKAAWITSLSEYENSNEDAKVSPDIENEAEKLYKKQLQLEQKLKKCDEDHKKFSEQLKEVKKELEKVSVEGLKDTRNAFDEAVKPVSPEEITEEKISGIIDKVTEFSRDSRFIEWCKNAKDNLRSKITKVVEDGKDKISGVKEKIADKVDDIEIEILENRALKADERMKKKWEEVKNTSSQNDAAREIHDYSKDTFKVVQGKKSKVIKGISAIQYIISNTKYKLKNGKFEKAVEKYQEASDRRNKYLDKRREIIDRKENRNSGMDR